MYIFTIASLQSALGEDGSGIVLLSHWGLGGRTLTRAPNCRFGAPAEAILGAWKGRGFAIRHGDPTSRNRDFIMENVNLTWFERGLTMKKFDSSWFNHKKCDWSSKLGDLSHENGGFNQETLGGQSKRTNTGLDQVGTLSVWIDELCELCDFFYWPNQISEKVDL